MEDGTAWEGDGEQVGGIVTPAPHPRPNPVPIPSHFNFLRLAGGADVVHHIDTTGTN